MDTADKKSLTRKLLDAGISKSYTSALVNGQRLPGYPLALRLEKEAGIRVDFWAENAGVAPGSASATESAG